MKIIPITVALILSFSNAFGTAQIKNPRTETITLNGNCNLCKSIIENAGSLKNVAAVEWDQNTRTATLVYNEERTNREEVLKRIALAGFDNELFYAPDEVYAALPACCRYQRNKPEQRSVAGDMAETGNAHANMEMPMEKHMEHATKENVPGSNPLDPVFEAYFIVKDALVDSDAAAASQRAADLLKALEGVDMGSLEMDAHMAWMKVKDNLMDRSKKMAAAKDIEKLRNDFRDLSENMYSLLKASKMEKPAYYQFCPMANKGQGANWLSLDSEVKNPYYGAQMLSCGKTVETIR